MQAGHPLTRLAAIEAHSQRWRSCADLAAYIGGSIESVRRAVRRGLIPHQRRPGAGTHGEIRVRADDFPLLRERFRQPPRGTRKVARLESR
jgi:hypothetical protein